MLAQVVENDAARLAVVVLIAIDQRNLALAAGGGGGTLPAEVMRGGPNGGRNDGAAKYSL